MKKILLSMLLGLLMMVTHNAQAQVVLFVTHPATVAGNKTLDGLPSTAAPAWGFGDIDTVPAVTGRLIVGRGPGGVAAGDSLACDTILANASAVSGKIAVLYRGSCEFGVKALAAQRAGAIGVVIVNNQVQNLNMGGGGVGSQVTIPVVLLNQNEAAALRPFIDDDSTVAILGNKLGLFANDIGFTPLELVRPNEWAIPSHQISDTGDYVASLGARIVNYGTSPRTNVSLNIQIAFTPAGGGTPAVIYNQTGSVASVGAGDTGQIILANFDPAPFGRGSYAITYVCSADGTEEFPGDNTITTLFNVTANMYSKGRLLNDTTVVTVANRPGGATGGFELGGTYYAGPKANRGRVMQATFQATAGAAFSLVNQPFVFTMYEWEDFNSDNIVQVGETFPVGEGVYTFTANETFRNKTIDVEDIATTLPGVRLKNNQRYVFSIGYAGSGTEGFFIGTDGLVPYFATSQVRQQAISPFAVGGTWGNATTTLWNGFASGTTCNIAIRMDSVNTTSVAEVEKSFRMTVYPNPAREKVNVRFSAFDQLGEVRYQIRDVAGRVIATGVHNTEVDGLDLTADLAGFNAGIYFMQVDTKKGAQTSKFIVK